VPEIAASALKEEDESGGLKDSRGERRAGKGSFLSREGGKRRLPLDSTGEKRSDDKREDSTSRKRKAQGNSAGEGEREKKRGRWRYL